MKVEPKLKFEVGEKVVIADREFSFGSACNWPDRNDFTITTITKVNEDGSVEVEGGYVYRQSYKTAYGFTEVHDYFRIKRVKDSTTFDSKEYQYFGFNYYVKDKAIFSDVTYLLKFTKEFEDKMIKFQEESDQRILEKTQRELEFAQKEARKKPYLDALKDVVNPLETKFREEKSKAWKEIMCAHCKYNINNHCVKWDYNLDECGVDTCSAFDVLGD